MKNLKSTFVLTIFLTVIFFESCINVIDGEAVISLMHGTYKAKWYPNVTFEQKAMIYNNDTLVSEQIWLEALEMGEGLTIKFDSISSGNGYIFKNDSIYVFKDGVTVGKRKRVHDILELGFNVYKQPVEKTIKKLKKADVDFSYYEQNNDYYIIGNPEIKRVWIEKERLLFYKIESKNENGDISKIEFNKYEPIGEGWIAPEVVFYTNDKITFKEEYFNIQLPDSLPNILDTQSFKSIIW